MGKDLKGCELYCWCVRLLTRAIFAKMSSLNDLYDILELESCVVMLLSCMQMLTTKYRKSLKRM